MVAADGFPYGGGSCLLPRIQRVQMRHASGCRKDRLVGNTERQGSIQEAIEQSPLAFRSAGEQIARHQTPPEQTLARARRRRRDRRAGAHLNADAALRL
jgi:hypothetical protein